MISWKCISWSLLLTWKKKKKEKSKSFYNIEDQCETELGNWTLITAWETWSNIFKWKSCTYGKRKLLIMSNKSIFQKLMSCISIFIRMHKVQVQHSPFMLLFSAFLPFVLFWNRSVITFPRKENESFICATSSLEKHPGLLAVSISTQQPAFSVSMQKWQAIFTPGRGHAQALLEHQLAKPRKAMGGWKHF